MIIGAYLASLGQIADQSSIMLRHAALAWSSAIRDETASFVVTFALADHLRGGRDAEFLDLIREPLRAAPALVDHPIVRYVNAAKHRNPIVETDFEFTLAQLDARVARSSLIALAAQGTVVRPVHWRTVNLIHEFASWLESAARILPLFTEMLETAPGDPKAIQLYRRMKKQKPSSFPGVVDAWSRLVSTRTTFFARLKADYL